jgi:large subunit ribosomal protein L1
VDIDIRLGVDPRHADQMVRGTVSLPHGTGKEVRVLALVNEAKQDEAREAGADHVGMDEYIKKIEEGWADIDVIIATPDAMGKLGKLGRFLGPRGLMPNPKSGTVTMDVADAVKQVKAGQIDFRVDKFGILHTSVGKISFDATAIKENAEAFLSTVMRLRPASAKGLYVKSVFMSSTMGPSIPISRTAVTSL